MSSDLPASGITVDVINAFLNAEFGDNPNQCVAVGNRWATASLSAAGLGRRPGGYISGPTVFAICDAALYYACFTEIGLEPMALTSEMSIRYMRPALGDSLYAKATLHYSGRRSMIGTVVAWTTDETRPCAAAQGTYVRPPVA